MLTYTKGANNMIKFFFLWTLITSAAVVLMYFVDDGTRKEVGTWSKRTALIGLAVALVLSVLVFLEGNL